MTKYIRNIIIGLILWKAPLLQAQDKPKPKGEIENESKVLNLEIDKVTFKMIFQDIETEELVRYGQAQITNGLDSTFALPFDTGTVTLELPIINTYQIAVNSQRYGDTTFVFDTNEVEDYQVEQIIKLIPRKEDIIIQIKDINISEDEIPIDIILTNTSRNEKLKVKGNSNIGEYIVAIRDTDLYRLDITDTGDYTFYSGEVKSSAEDDSIRVEVDFSKLEVGKKILLRDITFAPYSAELNEHVKAELNRIQTILINHPDFVIEIGGHTDSHDPEDDNTWLAQERAEAAFAYLVLNLELPSEQFILKGYQDTQPIASNATARGRAMNRRFELIVIDKTEASKGTDTKLSQF